MWVFVLLAAAGLASAGPAVLWMGADVPPPEVRARAERLTGPAAHVSASALAWPAHPPGAEEAIALNALRDALTECRGRWDAFDVERGVAWQLGEALARIGWFDDEDRAVVLEALVLQGSALYWAFPLDGLGPAEEAAPFLFTSGGERWNGPWVDALALAPERIWTRADFPDQTSYEAFLQVRSQVQLLAPATVRVSDLPRGAALVLDGRPVTDPGAAVDVPPGHHRVQVVRAGEIAGPGLLLLQPGEVRMLSGALSLADLARAGDRIVANRPQAVPASVKAAVEAWFRTRQGEPAWLAARRGRGAPALHAFTGDEPWSPAPYPGETLVLLEGRLAAGFAASDSFEESDLRTGLVPGGGAGISGEAAWRRLLLRLEIDALSTAGSVAWGTSEPETNDATSTLVRLAAAPGIYVVRPRPGGFPWHVALPLGVLTPAHTGFGLETGVGLPAGRDAWIRPTIDVWFGSAQAGFRGSSATTAVLRVGYARRL